MTEHLAAGIVLALGALLSVVPALAALAGSEREPRGRVGEGTRRALATKEEP